MTISTDIQRVHYWIHRKVKHIQQKVFPIKTKKIIYIMGCQRSGTSMLIRLFDWSKSTVIFKELDELFVDMRLKPYKQRNKIIDNSGARYVVAKPLLDSQHIKSILESDARISIIWPYRHFLSVAESNLKRFGHLNGHKDLSFIIKNDANDWRNEELTNAERALVKDRVSSGLSDHDAAALFWYLRNKPLLSLPRDYLTRIEVLNYERFVDDPKVFGPLIFQRLEIGKFPINALKEIRNVQQNVNMRPLDESINNMCSEVFDHLERLSSF